MIVILCKTQAQLNCFIYFYEPHLKSSKVGKMLANASLYFSSTHNC